MGRDRPLSGDVLLRQIIDANYNWKVAHQLYADSPIDPSSLGGVNHIDLDVKGKRLIKVQFDPLTNSGYRLYFRLDDVAAAGGITIADFKPQGFLIAGTYEEFWVDPDANETPYLHLLLTNEIGVAALGGPDDRVMYQPFRQSAD
jgi:hypothetical protein